MKKLSCCPYCQGDFIVKEVECQCCHTQVKGDFSTNRFHMFGEDELLFIELFLKNEGNIKLMEKDLSVSYPTIKNRLKHIINALGYESQSPSDKRIAVLNDLSSGRIDTKTAMKKLGALK